MVKKRKRDIPLNNKNREDKSLIFGLAGLGVNTTKETQYLEPRIEEDVKTGE